MISKLASEVMLFSDREGNVAYAGAGTRGKTRGGKWRQQKAMSRQELSHAHQHDTLFGNDMGVLLGGASVSRNAMPRVRKDASASQRKQAVACLFGFWYFVRICGRTLLSSAGTGTHCDAGSGGDGGVGGVEAVVVEAVQILTNSRLWVCRE